MKKITIVGAGGKMGMHISANLKNEPFDISYIEPAEAGKQRLATLGIVPVALEGAIPEADVVILAIPDIAIEKVAPEIVKWMKTGSMMITLDPAVPYAGKLPQRSDIAYFITHPCHPSVFNWEPTAEAQKDRFGGKRAKQSIVCTLMQGNESDYTTGEAIAKKMYAPVLRAHRITVEQMALLEPGLVETLSSTCIYVISEGLKEVIRQGVPAEAARDFLLGHLNIQLAVLFKELPGAVFSDAANKAIVRGMNEIFKPNWKNVLEIENVKEQIKAITGE
ncbi:phosphogluconate dehydrogenase C-terminal domain-containing protein [Parabacteroides pacaensis]|uniref:phosphogluconate dehydrogenase C-terminal domain-containing protein n=1 Tax=Parabacteroides pacaensis TaxID=2086575 RepID=UPI000D0ECDC6|nr:phosphogluconate dehydrogenase C-terminal domain-containing protein [Parabacteroides pacaensis]